jgi:N-acetylmuramoyl-L-alanine amidase
MIAFLAILSAVLAFLPDASAQPLQATEFRAVGDASRARVLVEFDREPEIKWFLLRNPHRLVIDMPETAFRFGNEDVEPRGMITAVRYGNLEGGVSRLIVSGDGPFLVEKLDIVANETRSGYRLVADFVAASEDAFETALADQIGTTGATHATAKGDRVGDAAPAPGRPFTVVIDAGHGGIDSGAEGGSGTLEKTITLAFALELKTALEADGRYGVHMTRDSDQFLTLDERVRIARQHSADLFISIHADAIRLKGMRGATVYTVADKASDADAAAKAIRENLSDQVAGIEIREENQEVADILVDLIRRETQSFSLRFARSLVGELSSTVEMVNNPHRFAGFKVLRAPDVPSVLLELGYLSNESDEKQLRDPDWRRGAIGSITDAIAVFAGDRLGAGG